MAAFVKIDKFVLNLGNGVFNLATNQLKVALTTVVPVVATANQLSDLTEVVYTNLSAREVTTTSFLQTTGTAKLICVDLVLTATGAVANFRYVVLYSDTATNDELIGYWDYGVGGVTLANGETFTIDFDGSAGVLTIA